MGLLRRLVPGENPKRSTVISPFALSYCLATGVQGRTAEQLAFLLVVPVPVDLQANFHGLLGRLLADTGCARPHLDYRVSIRLYLDSSTVRLSDAFKAIVGWGVARLTDFSAPPLQAAEVQLKKPKYPVPLSKNKFIGDQPGHCCCSRSRVRRSRFGSDLRFTSAEVLLSFQINLSVLSLYSVVLVSAAFIHGLWRIPFDQRSTRTTDFTVPAEFPVAGGRIKVLRKTISLFLSQKYNVVYFFVTRFNLLVQLRTMHMSAPALHYFENDKV